jgi:hypothetical protein
MMVSNNWRRLFTGVCFVLLCQVSLGGQRRPTDAVRVEVSAENPFRLRVTLRSIAHTPITIHTGDLPWMSQNRMLLVAVGPMGQCVPRFMAIADPPAGEVSLNPNKPLSGEINLTGAFKDLEDTVRRSELHLFWAYKSPDGLGLPQWSGGWILIPQQNRK